VNTDEEKGHVKKKLNEELAKGFFTIQVDKLRELIE